MVVYTRINRSIEEFTKQYMIFRKRKYIFFPGGVSQRDAEQDTIDSK